MFFIIVITGCLTHWHWKASLISHLSVVTPFSPFSTLEELLASSYQITTGANSAYQSDFEEATSGVMKDLWLSKFTNKEKSLVQSYGQSSQISLNEKYAQYIDYKAAKNLNEYKDCSLRSSNVFYGKIYIGFMFPKYSKFLPLFNSRIQAMRENGELESITRRYAEQIQKCQEGKGKPLGFENILIAFIILYAGCCFSFVIFLLEWIFSRVGYCKI